MELSDLLSTGLLVLLVGGGYALFKSGNLGKFISWIFKSAFGGGLGKDKKRSLRRIDSTIRDLERSTEARRKTHSEIEETTNNLEENSRTRRKVLDRIEELFKRIERDNKD